MAMVSHMSCEALCCRPASLSALTKKSNNEVALMREYSCCTTEEPKPSVSLKEQAREQLAVYISVCCFFLTKPFIVRLP